MKNNPSMKSDTPVKFAFFGTPGLSTIVLDELASAGYLPSLIVTAPDKPQGRGLVMTAPPVKTWADEHGIPSLQPQTIDEHVYTRLEREPFDVFIVVAYGKILPKRLLDIPARGVLNVHPSLLPHWRGPSPVVSGILADDRKTGVTVMLLDEKMDHGPIVAQRAIKAPEWPAHAHSFHTALMREGGAMLAESLPAYLAGTITPQTQDDTHASYCKKITREDGALDLRGDAYRNLLKIRAFEGWPGTFAYFVLPDGKRIRVKIISAHLAQDRLVIERVVPEGKKEMSYEEFLRSDAALA